MTKPRLLSIIALIVLAAFCLASCNYLPQLAEDAKEVLNDDCITLKVDKDAFQRDTDVKINVEVINKDTPVNQ